MAVPYSLSTLVMRLDEEDEDDFINSPTEYMKTLRNLQAHAKKISDEEENHMKTLTGQLPVSDRINVTRESKVLSIWHEKQQEWDKVKQSIQTKIHGNNRTKELLMDSIDNYRPKVEEYDTIQAARPLQERFWAESWSSTLRGGNTSRVVTIGNMYSGLECVIDKPKLPPIMIRKPASDVQMKTMSGQLSLFDPSTSKSLESRKTMIQKSLTKVRPHTLKSDHIDSLAIVSTDLFDWAIDSSDTYFNRQKDGQTITDSNNALSQVVEESESKPLEDDISCKVELLSPNLVLFSNRKGETTTNTITFRNTGDVAILYRWNHSNAPMRESIVESLVKSSNNIPRAFQLRNKRCHFICNKVEGIVLPGDTITTQFVYRGTDLCGLIQENWTLSCSPPAKFINTPSSSIVESNNAMKISTMIVSLHGMTVDIDESQHARAKIKASIDDHVTMNYVTGIIESCISRVRTPVSLSHVHDREIAYFTIANQTLIDNITTLSSNHNISMHITINRIKAIKSLCQTIVLYRMEVAKQYMHLSHLINEHDGVLVCSSIEYHESSSFNDDDREALQLIADTHADSLALHRIRQLLFPEGTLEVFDMINDDDISPRWDYSLVHAIAGLEQTLQQASIIPSLQATIQQRIKCYEKDQKQLAKDEAKRLKAEMKALRALEREDDDSDDDHDDEEDDNESEEEEALDIDPDADQHPVINEQEMKINAMIADCYNHMIALYYPELPHPHLYDITHQIICDKLVGFEQWNEQASSAAGMIAPPSTAKPGSKEPAAMTDIIYDRLESPYTSTQGAADWKVVLQAPMMFDKKKKGAIGLTPLPGDKAGKGAKSSNVLSASKEQVSIYYHNLYHHISSCLYDIVNDMFDKVDDVIQHDAHDNGHIHVDSTRLLDVGMYRSSDIIIDVLHDDEPISKSGHHMPGKKGKVVFVNIDGECFTSSITSSSSYSSFDNKAIDRKKCLRTIENIISHGAKAVICLYESQPSSNTTSPSFLDEAMPMMKAHFDALNLNTLSSTSARDEVRILYDMYACKTIAELQYNLQQYAIQQQPVPTNSIPASPRSTISTAHPTSSSLSAMNISKKKKKRVLEPFTVPIFILDDIRRPGVIPCTPSYQPPHDDMISLSIGEDEYRADMERRWMMKLHRVSCIVDDVTVDCYTSPIAAIKEVVNIAKSIQPSYDIIWIDDNLHMIYPKLPITNDVPEHHHEIMMRDAGVIMSSCLSFLSGNRLCSEKLREAMLWPAIIQSLPYSNKYFISDDHDHDADYFGDVIFCHHMQRIFPKITLEHPRNIKSIAVIGGIIKPDKFALLYRLVDLVDTIYIAGEMMIPLLAYSYQLKFMMYDDVVIKYAALCKQLMAKAKMRGTRIIFPRDISTGSLAINRSIISPATSSSASSDVKRSGISYDDGIDYDGDIMMSKLSYDISANDVDIIHDYVYDIGKESIASLREEVLSCDMIITWGTIGACEYSSFQDGQRSLIDCASQVSYDDRSNAIVLDKNKPSQTIVIGDASVEWYLRILDSDGEAGGDLVGNGVLSYVQRQSHIFTGLMGLTASSYVDSSVVHRPATSSLDEWVFNGPPKDDDDDDE